MKIYFITGTHGDFERVVGYRYTDRRSVELLIEGADYEKN